MTKKLPRYTSLRRAPSVALTCLLTLACTTYIPIKPTELPKLNNSFAAPAEGVNGELLAIRVAQVEAPDGKLVEIKGEFDVLIILKNHEEIEVTHPVRARFNESRSAIIVAGGNRADGLVPLDRIAKVEVSQPDVGDSVVAGALLGLGASLAVVFVLVG